MASSELNRIGSIESATGERYLEQNSVPIDADMALSMAETPASKRASAVSITDTADVGRHLFDKKIPQDGKNVKDGKKSAAKQVVSEVPEKKAGAQVYEGLGERGILAAENTVERRAIVRTICLFCFFARFYCMFIYLMVSYN